MEAAGLDDYPCLVIRGICDYSDAYKNDEWQEYAALTAAAYAKVLLSHVSPEATRNEKPARQILDQLDQHFERQHEHNTRLEEHNRRQESHYLDDRHRNCHRLFGTSDYERRKNINADAVPGTCLWVLNNARYREWSKSTRHDILWISADPGCGKSVLSKSLVDDWLITAAPSTTICYFFFKDNDEQSSLSTALCAVLHQLFSHQPALIRHALPAFDENKEEKLTSKIYELWRILKSAATDTDARPIFCVLDALDECGDTDRQILTDLLCQFYKDSTSSSEAQGCLKLLVTSRPHDDIRGYFSRLTSNLPSIRLRGEDENDQIRHEIDLVIDVRMMDMGHRLGLSDAKREQVTLQLRGMDNRTYLWLYLVLENIEVALKRSARPNLVEIPSLPATVYHAYESLLKRIVDVEEKKYAKMVLTIIVGARRPLSIAEMAIAFDVATLPEAPRSLADLTVDATNLGEKIRGWCGLFVFVKHNQLYLLHQTAKEFLLSHKDKSVFDSNSWRHCLSPPDVEREMARICVYFLYLSDFSDAYRDISQLHDGSGVDTFFDFASEHWASYVRSAESDLDDQIQSKVQSLYDAARGSARHMVMVGEPIWSPFDFSHDLNKLYQASLNGHAVVVRQMLRTAPDEVNRLGSTGMTSLCVAAQSGWAEIVGLLLAQPGIDPNIGHALSGAAQHGHTEVVRLLLAHPGTDINGGEALSRAAERGHTETIRLLLARPDIEVNRQNSVFTTPLFNAVDHGQTEVVKLLLAHPDIEVNDGRPLRAAASHGHMKIVEMLLTQLGIDISLQESLSEADRGEYVETLTLLLGQLDTDETDLEESLCTAARLGYTKVVEKLLAQPYIEVSLKQSLIEAAMKGHRQVVMLLLAQLAITNIDLARVVSRASSADIVEILLTQLAITRDNLEKPIAEAASNGHVEVVSLLLAQPAIFRANLDEALLSAASNGHIEVVKLLLAYPRFWTISLQRFVSRAALNEHIQILRLLLTRQDVIMFDLEAILSKAAREGHTEIVKLILIQPGNSNIEFEEPLASAAEGGFENIVELLLAQPKVIDVDLTQPLLQAAHHGNVGALRLLLAQPASVDINLEEIFMEGICQKQAGIVRVLLDQPGIKESGLADSLLEEAYNMVSRSAEPQTE